MCSILLVCAGGFSTSMLLQKMQKAADEQGVRVQIEACGTGDVSYFKHYDILLLAPQTAHLEEALKEQYHMPILLIDGLDYGSLAGAAVLKKALEKYSE